jgi:hypothetical protein
VVVSTLKLLTLYGLSGTWNNRHSTRRLPGVRQAKRQQKVANCAKHNKPKTIMGIWFFQSEGRPKEMKESDRERLPDLGRLLFPHETDAEPSHVLLFMSEHSRGQFDFLLSSGPAIVLRPEL